MRTWLSFWCGEDIFHLGVLSPALMKNGKVRVFPCIHFLSSAFNTKTVSVQNGLFVCGIFCHLHLYWVMPPMAEWNSIVWINHVLFIHSTDNTFELFLSSGCYEWRCFPHSCTSFCLDVFSFLRGVHQEESPGHMVILCLTIWGIARLFSKAAQFNVPHRQRGQVLLPPHLCWHLSSSVFSTVAIPVGVKRHLILLGFF